MKRRILAGLLSFVLVFNVFSLIVFAEESAAVVSDTVQTDYLLAEIEKNMTNESTGESSFDVSRYPKSENGSPLVIGGYESGIFDDLDAALYVYVYNPSEKELESVKGKWIINFTKSDGTADNGIATTKTWQLVGASGGNYANRFYKFKVTDLSDYAKDYLLDCLLHQNAMVDLTFTYSDGTKIVFCSSYQARN